MKKGIEYSGGLAALLTCSALLMCIALLMCSALLQPAQAQSAKLVYTAPDGVRFSVTANGLSTLETGGRIVASGAWHAMSGEKLFGLGNGALNLPAPTQKTFEKTGDAAARVHHVQGELDVTYEYSFHGNDAEIAARVENKSETQSLRAVSFGGLHFVWQGATRDNFLPVQTAAARGALGPNGFYPSRLLPVGGGYACDGHFGIGLSPLQPISRAARWSYHWQQDGSKSLDSLRFTFAEEVPPGASRVFRIRMRAAATADWKNLLAPYKEFFGTGDLGFQPDARPFAWAEIPSDAAKITAKNPGGYGGARIDEPVAANAWLTTLLPQLKILKPQALFVRGWAGADAYGAGYEVNPLMVLARGGDTVMTTLQPLLEATQTRPGLVVQPNGFAYRKSWTQDAVHHIDAAPGSIEPLHWFYQMDAFKAHGPAFFFQNFGDSFNDRLALEFYRSKMPRQTIVTERYFDRTLQQAAAVVNLAPQGAGWKIEGGEQLKVLRWLVPNAQFIARFPATAPVDAAIAWAKQNDFTPMIGVKP